MSCRLLLLCVAVLNLVGMSGCCLYCPLFCHSCRNYYAHKNCGPNYSACVTTDCCPECAGGVCGAHLNPIQQARLQRIERIQERRANRRMLIAMARMNNGLYGGPGYGDIFLDDPYGFDEFDLYGGGLAMPSTGMMSPGCNCQSGPLDGMTSGMLDGNWHASGWTQSEWVDVTPQPGGLAPQPLPPSSNTYAPPAAPEGGNAPVPTPMPMTSRTVPEQYYMPAPLPVQQSALPGPQTQVSTSSGASPIQQVLWVPNGL